jgi:hypothetical protein
MDKSPAPVSRGALERVLARASELQSATGDAPEAEAMTEAQIIELAKEVGLSPEHVRQALAEERARGEPQPEATGGLSTTVFGETTLAAQRVVPGKPEVVLAALDRWMQNEETMLVVRQRHDRMAWAPRQDFMSGVRRAFGSKPFMLEPTTEVAATVVPVDDGHSLIAMSADMSGKRRTAMAHLVTWTLVGAAGTAILSVLGFMTVVAAAPVVVLGVAAAYGSQRGLRHTLQRTQVGLEHVLDRLERQSNEPRPPSLLQMIDSALPRVR